MRTSRAIRGQKDLPRDLKEALTEDALEGVLDYDLLLTEALSPEDRGQTPQPIAWLFPPGCLGPLM
jgi:hypothetical protein